MINQQQQNKDLICKVAFTLIKQGIQCVPKKPGEKQPAVANWTKLIQQRKQLQNFLDIEHDGLCIVTGQLSGLTVLDFDNRELAKNFFLLFPMLKNFPVVQTNHGFHVYLPYIKELKNTVNGEFHIDVRNDGACVVAPPSPLVYKDGEENKGGEYRFVNPNFNVEKDLPNLKQIIYDTANKYKEEVDAVVAFYQFLVEIKSCLPEKLPIRLHERNNKIQSLIGLLANKNKEYSEEQIKMLCKFATVPQLSDTEVENQYKSYCKYHEKYLQDIVNKPNRNRDNNLGDLTSYKNHLHGPELISKLKAENIYFAPTLNRWVKLDDPNNKYVCYETYYREGVIVSEFCNKNKISTPIDSILNRLKAEDELVLKVHTILYYKNRLNYYNVHFKDCIIDLVSFRQINADSSNIHINLEVNDNFINFKQRTVNKDSFIYGLLHHLFMQNKMWDVLQLLYYNIDQNRDFQKFVIFTGAQDTGKSTFLKVIRDFFGKERVAFVQSESELQQEYYKTDLKDKIFCIMDDINLNNVKSEVFQQLTKGATVRCRPIYGRPEEFRLTSIFLIANNNVPTFINVQGMKKRCLIIQTTDKELPPKLVKYLEERSRSTEDNKSLLTQEEKEQFLLLLLKAKEMIDVNGGELQFSDELNSELKALQKEVFILQGFIDAKYVYNPTARLKFSEFRRDFEQYLQNNSSTKNLTVPNSHSLREDLQKCTINNKKIIIKHYTSNNSYEIIGLQRRPPELAEEADLEKTLERIAKNSEEKEEKERLLQEEEEVKYLSDNKLATVEDDVEEEVEETPVEEESVNTVDESILTDDEELPTEETHETVDREKVNDDSTTSLINYFLLNE